MCRCRASPRPALAADAAADSQRVWCLQRLERQARLLRPVRLVPLVLQQLRAADAALAVDAAAGEVAQQAAAPRRQRLRRAPI